MKVEEKFYLLVIDEIRAQPALSDEVSHIDLEDYGERFAGAPINDVLKSLSDKRALVTRGGLGFQILQELGPEPQEPPLDHYNQRTNQEGQRDNYEALCRGALLNLLWKSFGLAEDKVNLAKFLRDDWAFAHYVYGLLRGLCADVSKAHFELYLALHRETYLGARQRIDRALSLIR